MLRPKEDHFGGGPPSALLGNTETFSLPCWEWIFSFVMERLLVQWIIASWEIPLALLLCSWWGFIGGWYSSSRGHIWLLWCTSQLKHFTSGSRFHSWFWRRLSHRLLLIAAFLFGERSTLLPNTTYFCLLRCPKTFPLMPFENLKLYPNWKCSAGYLWWIT
jgi:hypothetical protein